MSGYVLRRHGDGAYVRPPGSPGSYTNRIEFARIFPSREAAAKDACGNESAVAVDEVLHG